jgi:serine/threonine-protein kinase
VHSAPTPAPAPERPAPEKPAPPSDTGGGGQAFLNINSIPASSVILDGKPIGQTPKLKFAVSPGSHSVLFVNADQGFKKQISVSVGAGETKPAIGRN